MTWPRRPDAARCQQQVHPGAARVVEDGFPRMNRADAQRIAHAGEARGRRGGQQRELGGVVAEIVGRVPRAAVKVKIAAGIARDSIVGREDLCAQPGDVESDGAGGGHDRSPGRSSGQAMIGASAAPIRSPCAGVIIPLSNSPKPRILHARDDVLPAIGGKHGGLHGFGLGVRHGPAADFEEVARIGRGLRLQDAVDGADQRDQVVHRRVARVGRELRVLAHPFELVEDRVLRLLLPVEQEHVLQQRRRARRRARCSAGSAPA